MTESKIELTERLRREGRWGEASKFKDTALKEFRAKGMKRGEAAEEAWEAMAKAFPPLPVVEPPESPVGNGDEDPDEDEEQARQNWRQAFLADVPGTIKLTVRAKLAAWAYLFGLSIPDDAQSRLEDSMAELVLRNRQ